MVTQQKLTSQILPSKTWTSQQQTLALASTQERSLINPSRRITTEDEVYLRDYALAAAVISWDECTYNSLEQVTAADITNIAIAGDTVWYQIQLHRAIPINIETFHAHRLQIGQHSSRDVLTAQPQQAQPNSSATKQAQHPVHPTGDSTGCQLRLDWQAVAEYDSGVAHGKLDAASRMHPICTQANCPYSQGYLDGYSSFLASQQQPLQVPKPIGWSVVYDPKWNLYQVWIGNHCLQQKAISYQEGERIARQLPSC